MELGAKVIVVDAMIPHLGGNLANLSDLQGQLQIQFLNLSDATSLAVLVPGCEFIFNLAGNVSHLDSMHDPITDLESNVRAQIVLLEACRRHAPRPRSPSPRPGRSMGVPITCRWTRRIRAGPWT